MFMPASNTLFCICLKCGTTSLYQYLFGAVHHQEWCDYLTELRAGQTSSACTRSQSAVLASMPPGDVVLGEEEPGLLLGEQEPRTFTVDAPADKAERLLLETLVGIGAMEREPEKHADEAALRQHVVGAHNEELDLSEMVDAKIWGNTFKSGPFPVSMWQDKRIYTHAIVRDPVERLISAYVNKLSCGLYSVPAGQRGDSGDQTLWQHVVEPYNSNNNDELYGAGFLKAANMGIGLQALTIKVPCRIPRRGKEVSNSRSCDDTNFTVVTCQGMSLDTYADAVVKIYRTWHQPGTWHASTKSWSLDGVVADSHLDVDVNQVNPHFRPQTGAKSCFQSVAPEDYDRVSTIADEKAMRAFSMHLATTKHGLWSNSHANSVSSGDLYFEGKPWQVPASVLHKLAEATRGEREELQRYL
jgi:hypothetical protein